METNKIKVTPEGRENMWIPEKESLKKWIEDTGVERIHHFIPTGSMIIGADHDTESVLKDIDNGDRLAIFTDSTANMGHSLAIIKNEKLGCYDIGKINEKDLLK